MVIATFDENFKTFSLIDNYSLNINFSVRLMNFHFFSGNFGGFEIVKKSVYLVMKLWKFLFLEKSFVGLCFYCFRRIIFCWEFFSDLYWTIYLVSQLNPMVFSDFTSNAQYFEAWPEKKPNQNVDFYINCEIKTSSPCKSIINSTFWLRFNPKPHFHFRSCSTSCSRQNSTQSSQAISHQHQNSLKIAIHTIFSTIYRKKSKP